MRDADIVVFTITALLMFVTASWLLSPGLQSSAVYLAP
jgi:hypothetical protein